MPPFGATAAVRPPRPPEPMSAWNAEPNIPRLPVSRTDSVVLRRLDGHSSSQRRFRFAGCICGCMMIALVIVELGRSTIVLVIVERGCSTIVLEPAG